MYPYSLDDLDTEPSYETEQVQRFYQKHIQRLYFLINHAAELLEAEPRFLDDLTPVALKMMEVASKRMGSLMEGGG